MRVRRFGLSVVAPGLLMCGCYTVLKAPYSTTGAYYDDSRYSRADQRDNMEPRLGRSDDRDGYRDPYGLYGPGLYGQPGFPVFGYDSRYGSFGGYGYGGYSPYSAGYGPHGYGYDPYYVGDGGVYIPPGYELVTTQELDRLRADSDRSTMQSADPKLDSVEYQQLQTQRTQDAWSSRVNAHTRVKRPQPTRRVESQPSTSSFSKPTADRDGSSSESSTTSSTGSGNSKPKKKRR